MEDAKIQSWLLFLRVWFLCFGVCKTGASSINNQKESDSYCENEITVSPYGGIGRDPYSIHDVKTINVTYSVQSVECITFINTDGYKLELGCYYQNLPKNSSVINLDLPDEYFTGISGTIGTQIYYTVVKSIKFTTNRKEYGPFGLNSTTPFSFQQTGGRISGFHGKAGGLVDTIGVYVKPLCSCAATVPEVESS